MLSGEFDGSDYGKRITLLLPTPLCVWRHCPKCDDGTRRIAPNSTRLLRQARKLRVDRYERILNMVPGWLFDLDPRDPRQSDPDLKRRISTFCGCAYAQLVAAPFAISQSIHLRNWVVLTAVLTFTGASFYNAIRVRRGAPLAPAMYIQMVIFAMVLIQSTIGWAGARTGKSRHRDSTRVCGLIGGMVPALIAGIFSWLSCRLCDRG